MSTIGIKIKQRREELGLTQEELAKMVGYKSKSSINKIEMGINDITQSKVVEFAAALKTTPAYIMGWEETPISESDFILTAFEKELLIEYRNADELSKAMVRRALSITKDLLKENDTT